MKLVITGKPGPSACFISECIQRISIKFDSHVYYYYYYFVFHWHYSLLWALACRTMSIIFSYLPPTLSIFSLPALEDLFLLPLYIFSWFFPFFSSLPVLIVIPNSRDAQIKVFFKILLIPHNQNTRSLHRPYYDPQLLCNSFDMVNL